MTIEERVWEIVKREGASNGGGDARIVVAVAAFMLEDRWRAIEKERAAIMEIVAKERVRLNRVTIERGGIVMIGPDSAEDWCVGAALARILTEIQLRAHSEQSKTDSN